MELQLQFTFRDIERRASVIVDFTEVPCYLFVFFKDEKLKDEFGDDISIPTDLEEILSRPGRNLTDLDNLKMAIFEAFKITKQFKQVKQLYPLPKKRTA